MIAVTIGRTDKMLFSFLFISTCSSCVCFCLLKPSLLYFSCILTNIVVYNSVKKVGLTPFVWVLLNSTIALSSSMYNFLLFVSLGVWRWCRGQVGSVLSGRYQYLIQIKTFRPSLCLSLYLSISVCLSEICICVCLSVCLCQRFFTIKPNL